MHLPVMDIQFALFKIQPEIIQAELLSPSGNHDDGHIGLLPDLPQHLHAVDVRQSQIQQNQVRMIHAKKGYAGQPATDDYQSLRVFMANIRRKIEDNTANPRFILTEVGVGYRFVDE